MPSAQKTAHAPVRAFVVCAVVGVFVIAMCSVILFDVLQQGVAGLVVSLLFYALAVTFTGFALVRYYPHTALGLCNMVTLLRLAMVSVLLSGLVAGAGPSWSLFVFALVTLSLDGVDGWLARRQNLTSSFGARFDMEVDAIFALVLALMALYHGSVGYGVLLLGLPSYLFFVAKFAFPWLDNPLPDLFSRKAVCVAQLAVLIGLQLPLDIAHVLGPLTLCVVAALVWSFGRDILWLARTRT